MLCGTYIKHNLSLYVTASTVVNVVVFITVVVVRRIHTAADKIKNEDVLRSMVLIAAADVYWIYNYYYTAQ